MVSLLGIFFYILYLNRQCVPFTAIKISSPKILIQLLYHYQFEQRKRRRHEGFR